ncbi:MAG: hypothetical protein SGPRY_013799 [Prymnesium sp.]
MHGKFNAQALLNALDADDSSSDESDKTVDRSAAQKVILQLFAKKQGASGSGRLRKKEAVPEEAVHLD